MKKLISILLVAMLILGMFPATALTAFAADTYEKATSISVGDTVILVCESKSMEMKTIGSQKYGEGQSYSGTPTGLVPLIVEEGYTSGTYSFKAPAGTYLYWTSGNYLQLNGTKSANTSWTVEFSGENAVIKNAKDSSRQIQWNASSPRFSTYTTAQTAIQLYKLSTGATEPEQPDVPACEHTETVAIGEAKEATCTEAGTTAGEKCAACDEVIEAQKEIPALGHNYADGTCSRCGAEQPEGFTLVTNASNLKAGDQIVIVAKDYAYAISTEQKTNNRGQAAVTKSGSVVTFGNDVQVLTLEAGTTSGTFAFNTGSGYLYAASSSSNYLKTESILTANSSWAITIAADGTATITAQGQNSRNTLQYNQSNSLFACYSSASQKALTIYAMSAGGGGSTECEHEAGTPVKENEVAATCTKEGSYVNVTSCTKCGAVMNRETVTLPMIEHAYENGACTSCGKVDPSVETKAEPMTALPGNTDKILIYHPASKTAMGSGDANSNSKLDSVSTEPVDTLLPYNTAVAVLTVELVGEYYAFKLDNGTYLATDSDGGQLTFAEMSDLAQWTVAASGDLWTFTNKSAVNSSKPQVLEYYNGEFTTYGGTGDAFNMALYLVEKGDDSCKHTNTEPIPAVEATCTETGLTEGAKCSDCGVITVYQTEVPALGHNYVDGVCSRCDAEEPELFYIAAYRDSEDKYYYMTSDLGTASTKRYQAVEAGVLPTYIATAETGYAFILIENTDGTYCLQADGVTGDNYLGWSSGNSGILVDAEKALKLTVDITEGGYYNIHFTGDAERYLSLNGTTGSDYFAWYKGTQKQDLTLVPVGAFPLVEVNGTQYNTFEEALAEHPDATLKLVADVRGVSVNGDLYLDLNGFAATNVTATKIYAYDSTATTAQAGTGSLTTTSDVAIDNTANGVRYVALKAEGTYTFHALEMQLTHVTLRTTAAGIYYKAKIVCDETLAAAVESYGVALSLNDMPGADFKTEMKDDKNANAWTTVTSALESGKVFTSGSVFNIFKSGADNISRGEMKIYANAYIQLGDSYIMVDTTSGDTTEAEGFEGTARSLRDVVSQLNDSYSTLSAEDQEKAAKFAKLWSSEMATWEMTTLQQAAEALPDEQPAE